MISTQVRSQACFELLASSSIGRYYSKAVELSRGTELESAPTPTLLAKMATLVDQVISARQRTPSEFEGALVLAVLLARPEPSVEAYLATLKTFGGVFPTMRWFAGMIDYQAAR